MKTTTKNPTTTTDDTAGNTVRDFSFAEQHSLEASTLRDEETRRELHAAIMGTSPSELSRGAEEACAHFTEQAKLNPIRSNAELKGRHVVRTPISFTMPCGTVITRY